jgi:hypothetical protein
MQDACLPLKDKVNEPKKVGSKNKVVKTKVNTVDIIDQDVYESLKREADIENISFRKYANEQLAMRVEKEKFMRKYMPKLSKLAFDEGILFIKDKEDGTEIAKVGLSKEGLVHCTLCKSDTCIHVMYALSMPELGRLEHLKEGRK